MNTIVSLIFPLLFIGLANCTSINRIPASRDAVNQQMDAGESSSCEAVYNNLISNFELHKFKDAATKIKQEIEGGRYSRELAEYNRLLREFRTKGGNDLSNRVNFAAQQVITQVMSRLGYRVNNSYLSRQHRRIHPMYYLGSALNTSVYLYTGQDGQLKVDVTVWPEPRTGYATSVMYMHVSADKPVSETQVIHSVFGGMNPIGQRLTSTPLNSFCG